MAHDKTGSESDKDLARMISTLGKYQFNIIINPMDFRAPSPIGKYQNLHT